MRKGWQIAGAAALLGAATLSAPAQERVRERMGRERTAAGLAQEYNRGGSRDLDWDLGIGR